MTPQQLRQRIAIIEVKAVGDREPTGIPIDKDIKQLLYDAIQAVTPKPSREKVSDPYDHGYKNGRNDTINLINHDTKHLLGEKR